MGCGGLAFTCLVNSEMFGPSGAFLHLTTAGAKFRIGVIIPEGFSSHISDT